MNETELKALKIFSDAVTEIVNSTAIDLAANNVIVGRDMRISSMMVGTSGSAGSLGMTFQESDNNTDFTSVFDSMGTAVTLTHTADGKQEIALTPSCHHSYNRFHKCHSLDRRLCN